MQFNLEYYRKAREIRIAKGAIDDGQNHRCPNCKHLTYVLYPADEEGFVCGGFREPYREPVKHVCGKCIIWR